MTIHLLISGDSHGHIRLLFRQVRVIEQILGVSFDLVLHVGDLGVFPDPTRADRATRRKALADPERWSFARCFAVPDEDTRSLLRAATGEIGPPVVFVHGNHEDFAYLLAKRGDATGPVPVNVYGVLRWLPPGSIWTFVRNGRTLHIGGLGGIEPSIQRRLRCPDDRLPPRYVRLGDALRLASAPPVNVLITHDAPLGVAPVGHGSPAVLHVLRQQRPALHCFGHYHRFNGPHGAVEGVTSIGLGLNAPRIDTHLPAPGSLLVVRWNDRTCWDVLAVSMIDADRYAVLPLRAASV